MTTIAPDFERREAWVDLLSRLTDGFVRSIPPGGSPAAATLPGAPPGHPVPAIEGFARMSVAWAALLHEPSNPTRLRWAGREHDVAALLAHGLTDATDPSGGAWWGPIGDRDQRIVEAAEIATALYLGGDRLRVALEAIDPRASDRVLDWLAGEARRQAALHRSRTPAWRPVTEHWAARAEATAESLACLAKEARGVVTNAG